MGGQPLRAVRMAVGIAPAPPAGAGEAPLARSNPRPPAQPAQPAPGSLPRAPVP